jgi:hypothetical protein
MKRLYAFGVIVAAVGTLLAAPVPVENKKPAAFPAGHYVLAGSGEPARGEDVFEFTKPFQLRSTQYILSGGPKPTDLIFVDDDLEVYQEKAKLFVDDDHVRTTENRGKQPARYKGEPIVLVLDASKKLRIVAIDCGPTEAIIGQLWLHRWDGARKKLTDGVSLNSPPNLPAVFFEESYSLNDGFELPEKNSTDVPQILPEKPSKLLPRFQQPVQPVDKPQSLKPEEFLYQAVLDGLTEDGVLPALAGSIAQNPDFFAKCSLYNPTHRAFEEYAKRMSADKPKEGKGLSDDLAKKLKSTDKDIRRAALRELVAGYMDRGYGRTTIAADQKKSLEKALLEMRGVPKANGDPNGFKFCPSCDGACRLLPNK